MSYMRSDPGKNRLLSLVGYLMLSAWSPHLAATESAPSSSALTLVSFNTGLVKWAIDHYEERKLRQAERLARLGSDLICLSEVWREEDQKFMAASLRGSYPYSYAERSTHSILDFAAGHNGLMILSRHPLSKMEIRRFDSFFIKRAALVATAELPGSKSLRFACTHLSTDMPYIPYWGTFKSWDEELMSQVKTIAAWKDLDIVMGDFNLGPAKPGITPFKEDAYQYLLKSGLTAPYAESNDAPCTWCAENPLVSGRENYLIDHIFFYRPTSIIGMERLLYEDFKTKNNETTKLSDHAAIAVRFQYR